MKLKNNEGKIFPKFAYIPVILVIVFNCLTFWGSKLITQNAHHYDLSTPLDYMLPFSPCFMFFYILAYFQWVWNYVYHTRLGREKYYHIVTVDLLAKTFALFLFIVMPAEITRPEVSGNGFWENVTRLMYSIDTPTALFPSYHCLESWLCFRAALMVKDAPRWYAPFQLILTLFVFASTVLVKQHFIVDVFAGIAVVEIAWFLSKRFHLWRFLSKIRLHFVKTESANEDLL